VLLPKTGRPLTEHGLGMLKQLFKEDVLTSTLNGYRTKMMRALYVRGFASPCEVDGQAAWRITNEGQQRLVNPPPPPPPPPMKSENKNRQRRDGDGVAMTCPVCGSLRLRVADSRDHRGSKRRRRECPDGHRFWTMEVLANNEGDIIDPAHPETYNS
jgi:hypothetical protein